jgi:regulator of protease activity HflC (stomatin/prohibitin superfamily)
MISSKGVIVESTPLRNVALPPQLVDAIEQMQRADQESQRMQFVLTKEQQEADRRASPTSNGSSVRVLANNCSAGRVSRPPRSFRPRKTPKLQ